MAKSPVGEVWGLRHGKLHLFSGVRIGQSMLTFPDGQRCAKDGRGTDGYYATELDAARGMVESARWSLEYHRRMLANFESIVADCERVLAAAPGPKE